jgi:hypothetical protein
MLVFLKMYVSVFKKFSPITEESATSTSDLLVMHVHTRVRVGVYVYFLFFLKSF